MVSPVTACGLAVVAGLAFSFLTFNSAASLAAGPDRDTVAAGKSIVTKLCASCHAVTAHDTSAHPDAPMFRTLSNNYPIIQLDEALGEGIMTGHPDMPVFAFEPAEVEAILAYLESIQSH